MYLVRPAIAPSLLSWPSSGCPLCVQSHSLCFQPIVVVLFASYLRRVGGSCGGVVVALFHVAVMFRHVVCGGGGDGGGGGKRWCRWVVLMV